MLMTKEEYVEWYVEHYGKNPPPKLLEKYFPGKREPAKAPEPDFDVEDLLS